MTKACYWDFPRSITSIVELVTLAGKYGVSEAQCLIDTNIHLEMLQQPTAQVGAQQELKVISNLLRQLGTDVPLGLEAGSRNHITTFGAWGLAILSSPTFYDAVDVGMRYVQLTSTYCQIKGVVTDDEAILRLDDSLLPEALRPFLLERDFATLMTLQFDLDPVNLPVHALRFKRDTPVYGDLFNKIFNVVPEFNQSSNDLVLSRSKLKLKLPQSNGLMQQYFEDECQKLHKKLPINSLSSNIRNRLARQPAHMPSINVLAQELELHPRQLRRQLAAEGTHFDKLGDDVRQTMALELLTKTDLSIEEVSDRLGYSEVSAFSRAFKRWHQVSPRKYLQQQKI